MFKHFVLLVLFPFYLLTPAFVNTSTLYFKDITFNQISSDITIDIAYDYTMLSIEYELINNYHYDVTATVLTFDAFLEDEYVKQITFYIPHTVKHHRSIQDDHTIIYDDVYFDEIRWVGFDVVEDTFFASYRIDIVFAVFYVFVIFFMWMIGDRHRGLTFSEVHEILRDYWWAVLILGVVIPALISAIIFYQRFYVLATLYGWVFLATAFIAMIIAYGLVVLFHSIENIIK